MTVIDSPGPYAAALLEKLGERDLFDVLESTPAALRARFEGVGDADLRRPEGEGKWSMLDVAHHLADGEMVVAVRIRMIVAQDTPPIVAYDQELWASKLRYREAALEDVLAQFEVIRAANVRLAKSLTEDELRRYGVHEERGGESAGYLLRLLAGHDLVHLAQLDRIAAAVR